MASYKVTATSAEIAAHEKWLAERAVRRENHRKDALLRQTYGLVAGDVKRLLIEQNGGCAVCQSPPVQRALIVDHDHKTGRVRGLLCHACNSGLGMFRDDPSRLHRAILYLEGNLPTSAKGK